MSNIIIENNIETNENTFKYEQNILKINQQISTNQNNINEEYKNKCEINLNKEYEQQLNIEDIQDNYNKNNINNIISENLNIINIKEKTNSIIIENEEINKLNINLEKSKNEPHEENLNKINFLSNTDDTKMESFKVNEYIDEQNSKSNKEYSDKDDDITSRRLTIRNNNDQYLLIKEGNNNNKNHNINENIISNDEDEEKEEELFPFRIIGDIKKKSGFLGKYNSRYFEIDSIKGLVKRYKSSKEYPKRPKEIIDIRNIKLVKQLKNVKDYYDLEITYTVNKKGKNSDKILYLRLRHGECRNKWFDSLIYLWKYYYKGTPVPKFTKNILLFIDDRIGIIQELGKKKEKNNISKSEINIKKFKILSLLGIGGFGTVFKVKHILTDKIYAMKVMNKNYIIKKKYLHYVVSEFEIMKSLAGFPFILDIHYCFQSANYLYLVMDYCPNGDFTKLRKINNLKLFLAEVILAFEYIHNHNIVYRDLKPENILLDLTGHIKVCDFNLAKAGITKDKRTLSFCGSPMYFSPEMLSDKGVNYKCDIYGIGLLMYELATGVPAYTAPNIQALYEKIRKNKINFKVSGLHGDIKDLIEKILVKNPEQRLSLEKIKEHPYFKDIDFNKVLRKEYGKIETEKYRKISVSDIEVENDNKINIENNDEFESEKFKLQQKKLDENKEYSFLDGKISVKEMYLDQKRFMKNYVKDFYYIKKEDMEQNKDFKLDIKCTGDISSLIMEQYKFEV